MNKQNNVRILMPILIAEDVSVVSSVVGLSVINECVKAVVLSHLKKIGPCQFGAAVLAPDILAPPFWRQGTFWRRPFWRRGHFGAGYNKTLLITTIPC
jgi:hypothetical protein